MILVTGANGFVGRAVIARLLTMDGSHQPVAAVRELRAVESGIPGAAKVVEVGDINGSTNWSKALQGVTAVIHCAARVHVMNDNAADALAEYRRINVEGTLNLAQQAALVGVRRFVYVSSIKVNGEATRPGESFSADDVVAPLDPYGISKYEAEQGLMDIGRDTLMQAVVVRPPLVYGRSVKANFLAIMRWVQKSRPLPLAALTNNRRSLVALGNLVDLLVTCIDHEAAAGQVFLISDGHDLSTAELIHAIAAALQKPPRLFYVPVALLKLAARLFGRHDAMQRLTGNLQVDIDKTRNLLGWNPPISVREGMRRAAETI